MYQDKIVLCGANSYEEKFYMNPDFDNLPQHIKDELKIMCVLYVHDVGGILTLVFEENGELEFEVTSAEGDPMFDEIGSRLKIKEIQTDEKKQELLTQLQLYYKVFFWGKRLNDKDTDDRKCRASEPLCACTDGRGNRPAISSVMQGTGSRASVHGNDQCKGAPV